MATAPSILKVELTALAALAVSAMLYAAFVMLAYLEPSSEDALGQFALVSIYTFGFGLLPVVLAGAPVYHEMRRRGFATWLSALTLGVVPGAALAFIDPSGGAAVAAVGAIVAVLTHVRLRGEF